MIPSYEQMGDWLEEIVQQFPAPFFAALDGGVQLEEQALPDPDFPHGQMYILGEYCHDLLGRYIVLYYGSFAALFPDAVIQSIHFTEFLHTGFAFVEPKIHHCHGILCENAAVHLVSVQIFSLELRKCSA